MATIKAFSDLEQSKKLAEILSFESADMYYWCADHYPKEDWIIEVGSPDNNYECISAWSLVALLGVLPVIIGDVLSENALRLRMDKSETEFTIWYENLDSGMVEEGLDIIKSSPVDACYEMILKLKELKML